MTDTPRALLKIANQDAKALHELSEEVYIEVGNDSPDPDLILPLCKEVQARAQAVYNRVAEATGRGRNNDAG